MWSSANTQSCNHWQTLGDFFSFCFSWFETFSLRYGSLDTGIMPTCQQRSTKVNKGQGLLPATGRSSLLASSIPEAVAALSFWNLGGTSNFRLVPPNCNKPSFRKNKVIRKNKVNRKPQDTQSELNWTKTFTLTFQCSSDARKGYGCHPAVGYCGYRNQRPICWEPSGQRFSLYVE